MDEPRLRSEIWVKACVRRGLIEGITVTIGRRGDAVAGAVIVVRDRLELGCEILVETRDPAGDRAWLEAVGAARREDDAIASYLERSIRRDPDLWILEVEDRLGRLPFEARILGK